MIRIVEFIYWYALRDNSKYMHDCKEIYLLDNYLKTAVNKELVGNWILLF